MKHAMRTFNHGDFDYCGFHNVMAADASDLRIPPGEVFAVFNVRGKKNTMQFITESHGPEYSEYKPSGMYDNKDGSFVPMNKKQRSLRLEIYND